MLLAFSFNASGSTDDVEQCSASDDSCVPIGQWSFSIAVGLGVRTNPVIENDNIPIILLPTISYYGERFFWETDTIGYTLHESRRHMINFIGTVSYDQAFFNDFSIGNFSIDGSSGSVASSALAGPNAIGPPEEVPQRFPGNDAGGLGQTGQVPEPSPIDFDRLHDRDIAGLVGIEYGTDIHIFSIGVQALQDISAVHHGQQVRAALSTALVRNSSALEVSAGAEWKDAKTVDYFYGVREDEVDDAANVYRARADISYYLKLDWHKELNKKWKVHAILHNRWFGDQVRNSPIVDDNTTLAVFLGGAYQF